MDNLLLSALTEGKLEKALKFYQETINREPLNALAHQNLSIVLGNLGRYKEAFDTSTKALELNSELVLPHVTLAYVYDEFGNKEKSREEAKIALSKAPESPEVLCCLGILSLIDNKQDEAKKYLEKVVSIEPSFYLAQYNLATVYQNNKDNRKLFAQTLILFRLKPNIKNMFRLFYIYSRVYKFADFPILIISVLLSLLFGARFVLVVASLLVSVYFLGGVFIGFMTKERQWRSLFYNVLLGIGTAIFGFFLYLLTAAFLER